MNTEISFFIGGKTSEHESTKLALLAPQRMLVAFCVLIALTQIL
jgi:hypothetical protein